MPRKPFLISGLTSSSLAGAGLIGALLSVEKAKETLRGKLLNAGYIEVKKFGEKLQLLRQYSDFPEEISNLGLQKWCKQKGEKSEKEGNESTKKQYEEFCFETVASKIHGGDYLILNLNEDVDEWNANFEKFKQNYKLELPKKPSSIWNETQELKDFKGQCKKNERNKFIDENDTVYQEVKEYCARKFGSSNGF